MKNNRGLRWLDHHILVEMSKNGTYNERVSTVSFRCSTDLKDDLDELVAELDVSKREWLEAQIEDTKLDFTEAVEHGQELRTDKLESELNAKDDTIRDLEQSISIYTDRIHQLQEERRSQNERIERLEDHLGAKERRIETLARLIESKDQQYQKAQDELEDAREERANMRREIERLQSLLVDDISKVARTVQGFEKTLLERVSEIYDKGRVQGMAEISGN